MKNKCIPFNYPGDKETVIKEAKVILKKYTKLSDYEGFKKIVINWSVILVCSSFYFILPENTNAILRYAVYIAAMFVIAGRFRAFESCLHEAVHNLLFKTRAWNTQLQFLFAWPIFQNVESYKEEHFLHHTKFGTSEDPSLQYLKDTKVDELPNHFFWVLFVRPLFGSAAYWVFEDMFKYLRIHSVFGLLYASFWILFLATLYLIGGVSYLTWFFLFYVIPLVVIFPIFMHLAEINDHAVVDFSNPISASRNNISSFIHKFFLHPHNDGYHVVHHLFPGVPSHQLVNAYEELLRNPKIRPLCVNAKSFYETLQQLSEKPNLEN